jgi:hypothetical protein
VPAGDKLNLFEMHKHEYVAKAKPALVTVGPAIYLAIDGMGAPGGEEFQSRIEALYGMAYTVKMMRKAEGRGDYVVGKLEMAYPPPEGGGFGSVPPEEWRWTMLIRTPEAVTTEDLSRATEALALRGKAAAAGLVRLRTLEEGRCVQMLHVGPYDAIGTSVAAMREFALGEGLRFRGQHHEIYLSDPRRVAPEKLKTILREPVERS